MLLKIIGGITAFGLLVGFIGCKKGHHKWCKKNSEEKTEWMMKKAKSKLDLNDDQAKTFKIFLTEAVDIKKQMHRGSKEKKEELLKMVSSEELDQDRIIQVIEEKQKVFNERLANAVALLADFHKSLNSDQKEKIVEFAGKHKSCKSH